MNETIRDSLTAHWFADGMDPARYDPIRAARGAMASPLPKRFYTAVSTEPREGGFALLLDGRPARTKGRALISVPNAAAAALLVDEWAAQGGVINPATMPATRLVHAALDHVTGKMAEVAADIVKYASSDLVCYRAAEPDALVARQAAHWDPVLDHVRTRYGARFVLSAGIVFVEQPAASLAAIAARVRQMECPIALSSLHALTSLAGSALIALMVADGAVSPQAGFDAGEVDGDYAAAIWGGDDEAEARRAARRGDFLAAAKLFSALGDPACAAAPRR